MIEIISVFLMAIPALLLLCSVALAFGKDEFPLVLAFWFGIFLAFIFISGLYLVEYSTVIETLKAIENE